MNRIARQIATLALVAGVAIAGPTAVSAAEPQSACAQLGGTVDAKQVCRAHTEGPGYQVTFTFPVDYPDQQAVETYVTVQRDAFIGFKREKAPDATGWEIDARANEYHSGTSTSGTKSLVFEQYNYSGGAHPVTGFDAFNYDLGKGAAITLDTLFKPGIDPVQVLDPIVARQIQKQWEGYEGPAPVNTLGATVYQDFAITDDAVIFFIGQGMWLPQVAGPQRVSVPRAELESVLA